MQAAQDITIGARLNKTQFQYTMNDADPGELKLAKRQAGTAGSVCGRHGKFPGLIVFKDEWRDQ
jgi:hypothetical protein